MKWRGPLSLRAIALLGGTLVLASSPVARADVKASQTCRKTLGVSLGKIANAALKNIDKCYKTQHKADQSPAQCNVAGSAAFDPDGKYAVGTIGNAAKIDAKCLAGDPVLANYPTGDAKDVIPILEENVTGNAVLVLGNQDLGNPKTNKADVKCVETISKNRNKIYAEILKGATKCQATKDATATSFGALDPACVVTAVKAGPAAAAKITDTCASASADAGACFPLPACAVDAATVAAQAAARDVFSTQPPAASVCGNGVVESPEQCDDGNAVAGDGCSAACETEGRSCDAVPGSAVIGTRSVTVALNTPIADLAGVELTLDYPQFQSGIPGTGQSSIVASRVHVLQGVPGDYLSVANDRDTDLKFVIGGASNFITTGPLVTFTLDACVPLAEKLCNRNQNVISCCTGTTCDPPLDPNAPPKCNTFPAGTIGAGDVAGCCPADNACVSQQSATTCSVSGAVDSSGTPVEGVTCSVTIAGS